MAQKTIPQLNEETDINGESLFVFDSGTETFKIKAKNFLQGKVKYAAIIGSAAQVTANLATHSTFASAIAAASAGDVIQVLPGTWVENVSVTKQLKIVGAGYGSYINGSLSFTSAADRCSIEGLRVNNDITLAVGADGNTVKNVFLPSGKTFIDNGEGNLLEGMQE